MDRSPGMSIFIGTHPVTEARSRTRSQSRDELSGTCEQSKMSTIIRLRSLIWLLIELRYVNPTQLVTRVKEQPKK